MTRSILILLGLAVTPAMTNDGPYQAAINAHSLLKTTFLCQSITRDTESYEKAKGLVPGYLERNNVTEQTLESLVEFVENNNTRIQDIPAFLCKANVAKELDFIENR